MRWTSSLLLAASLVVPAAGSLEAATRSGPQPYVVVLEDSVVRSGRSAAAAGGREVADAAAELSRLHSARVTRTWNRTLRGFAAEMTPEAAKALARHPWVKSVEPDAVIRFSAVPDCYTGGYQQYLASNPTSPQTVTCADPQLNCKDNWGLDRIDQRTYPRNGTFTFANRGEGVHLYFIDSGLATAHPEFGNGAGGSRVGTGISFATPNPNDLYDGTGHGTHVTAIAAGLRFGVAKRATIHPVRVANSQGLGTLSMVLSGVEWVSANAVHPAVVNASFNYPKFQHSEANMTALSTASRSLVVDDGITVVNSAGNWNRSANAFSPTDVPEVIVAAGLDWFLDQRWGAGPNDNSCKSNGCGSNYGSAVDLFAPAVEVLSASNDATAVCSLTGTSMAAPHTVGVAALYLQSNPLATPAQMEAALISLATVGAVQGQLGVGTPNRLLYTNF